MHDIGSQVKSMKNIIDPVAGAGDWGVGNQRFLRDILQFYTAPARQGMAAGNDRYDFLIENMKILELVDVHLSTKAQINAA